MKYKWILRNIETGFTIQQGQIEAKDQEEALEKLNKEKDIHPHTAEILEIIEPDDLSSSGMRPLVLT